ncbi:ribosome small subunit-dependent GTPase A [Photobacterium gaetbulicola]|uniref:Small ribosomal subunit biogenesis GTPase RsgA n=1 Tax=Photobacterium gaetbulicola Gung47 TaxID=658445 RepID=A0A0C5WG07_9GAMM|nr:ribosome small subunit-dependent GTPase A [Photobacterium gaetbulicola]AJR06078.1 ribosome-associated GTPase [Photobacterium gaetbulicola Gung47]PSU02731.1 ribosome small subunit-dependent GTPase A [Photobacterium gaetbulicola]
MNSMITLSQLGWQPVFQQQLTLEDYEQAEIARILAHHRNGYALQTEAGSVLLEIHHSLPTMTVGDWVLIDSDNRFIRLLERVSLFSRKAAGAKVAEQYIASNVDTLFIVCSLNQDFNLSRIERYLAIAREANVEPVVILTKADLCEDGDVKRKQVQALDPMLMVEMLNALDVSSYKALQSWCRIGKTIAFMGSSGVGKSTLVNTLMGGEVQQTSSIREDDSKGRHTTTSRSLHFMPSGAVLIDTPGMRELQLTDCESGVHETFADIEALSKHCRFSDCQHQSEPGCAIQQALESGEVDERRLHNYFKLLREQARNTATLSELRNKDKQFGKMCRSVQSQNRKHKKGY